MLDFMIKMFKQFSVKLYVSAQRSIESCHGDPEFRPFHRGQRSPEKLDFQLGLI